MSDLGINGAGSDIYGIYNVNEEKRSMEDMFHQLQLEMAAAAKKDIATGLNEIRAGQEEQKYVADLLRQARRLQADAKAGKGDVAGDSHASFMPQAMKDYMDANGLAYDTTGKDMKHNAGEWEVAINSLQSHLETLGMDTQQDMVFIQDDMGRYRSHLESPGH